jgi:hypothetical protein
MPKKINFFWNVLLLDFDFEFTNIYFSLRGADRRKWLRHLRDNAILVKSFPVATLVIEWDTIVGYCFLSS